MSINKKIICPLCESETNKRKFRTPHYSIYYCSACKVEFNADFPPKQSVNESFSKEYYTELQKEAFSIQEKDYKFDPSYESYKNGLKQIEKFIDRGKLLDVGAGMGAFMKTASDAGWDVEGVEISQYGSEFIKGKYGFTVYRESLISMATDSRSYDVITYWDVIEHVEFPKKQLIKAYELLKPGGVLLLTSDNYSSLMSFLGRFIYYLSFGKFTYPIERFFIPYNKTYFNHNNMEVLLRKIGYEIIFFNKMQYPLSKIKSSFFEKFILKIIYDFERFLNIQSQFTFIVRKSVNSR